MHGAIGDATRVRRLPRYRLGRRCSPMCLVVLMCHLQCHVTDPHLSRFAGDGCALFAMSLLSLHLPTADSVALFVPLWFPSLFEILPRQHSQSSALRSMNPTGMVLPAHAAATHAPYEGEGGRHMPACLARPLPPCPLLLTTPPGRAHTSATPTVDLCSSDREACNDLRFYYMP